MTRRYQVLPPTAPVPAPDDLLERLVREGGKFQRRDFRFDALTQSAAAGQTGNLFAQLSEHEIFTPIRTYAPITVRELAV
ncbi:MAG: hypothetical protein ACREN7_07370 [Candidatus Dormibacteria bacterium]